jgi:serine/threonine protein kinase
VKIGEGSFGNVYKCFDIKSKEVRAVKVLKNAGMNNRTKMGFIA